MKKEDMSMIKIYLFGIVMIILLIMLIADLHKTELGLNKQNNIGNHIHKSEMVQYEDINGSENNVKNNVKKEDNVVDK